MGKIYSANGDFSFGEAEYKEPPDFTEIDRAIRHMPGVVEYTNQKAQEMLDLIPSKNFHVIEAGGESRFRAYVTPSNRAGVMMEKAFGLLVKAATAMRGK